MIAVVLVLMLCGAMGIAMGVALKLKRVGLGILLDLGLMGGIIYIVASHHLIPNNTLLAEVLGCLFGGFLICLPFGGKRRKLVENDQPDE